ncbi:disulfide bond formation protein B [uncultured Parasphingopyxis sp.]|uniref:disulfide bond formation protein B n=1 Tax=uncultured Parasphingopyxis sp. TaxID=1547918 RepID=UPI00261DCB79|nr:disulfide bond formation protein B [uncultured Parasphingopyxis sp.]
MTNYGKARLIAFAVPLALLAGALGSQYLGGLYPCEMCHWQRWPHYAAVPLAALSILFARQMVVSTLFLSLAMMAIFTSGVIGVFHAGVEYGWWQGLTACTMSGSGSGNSLADIMAAPLVSCDEPQWTLFGISLAGFNAIISIGTAIAITWLATRKTK